MMNVRIEGSEEVAQLLESLAPREALKLSRNTVHGVAGEIAKLVKRNAPKDQGDMVKAVKTKRRRMQQDWIGSDVVVQRGNDAKVDGFYWRFLEDGTSETAPRPFILPSVREVEARLPDIVKTQFILKLEAAMRRAQRRRGG